MGRRRKKRRELSAQEEKWFLEFFAEYPKRVAKYEARKAFAERPPWTEERFNSLIKSVKVHKRSWAWRKNQGEFIPYPASFIRAGMDEDEIEVEPAMPPQPKICSRCGMSLTVHEILKQWGAQKLWEKYQIKDVCEEFQAPLDPV